MHIPGLFFSVEFSPLSAGLLGVNGMGVFTAGAGVHDWMAVSTAGLEGPWWAGGHAAGMSARPHIMVVGPHIVHLLMW